MTARRLGLLCSFALLASAVACLAGAFGGDPVGRISGGLILSAALYLVLVITPDREIES